MTTTPPGAPRAINQGNKQEMTDKPQMAGSSSIRVVAGLGLLWNLFGAFRFVTTEFADKTGRMAAGMTPSQAAMYADLPVWMTFAFAVCVFGGAIGCLLLLMKRRQALPVFWASLAGYVVLYLGDIALGVFAAFGTPQIMILTLVLLIAVALLWFAQRLSRRRALV